MKAHFACLPSFMKDKRFWVLALTVPILLGLALLIHKRQEYFESDSYVIAASQRAEKTTVRERLAFDERHHLTLTFEGISAEERIEDILAILEEYQTKGIFFVTAEEAREFPEFIQQVKAKGHAVGSLGIKSGEILLNTDRQELVRKLNKASKIIGDQGDLTYVRAQDAHYSEEFLEIATVKKLIPVHTKGVINYQSFADEDSVKRYLAKFDHGDVITVRLNGHITEEELALSVTKRRPQTATEADNVTKFEEVTNTDNINNILKWLLANSKHEEPTIEQRQLRDKNQGELAEVVTHVATTSRQNGLLLSHLGSDQELDQLLAALKKQQAVGNFFLNEEELRKKKQVDKLLAAGHKLNVLMLPDTAQSFYEIHGYLQNWFDTFEKQGYGEKTEASEYAMTVWGTMKDSQREALKCFDLKTVEAKVNLQKDELAEAKTANDVLRKLSENVRVNAQLGDMIHLRLGFYQEDKMAAAITNLLCDEYLHNELVSLKALIKEDPEIYQRTKMTKSQVSTNAAVSSDLESALTQQVIPDLAVTEEMADGKLTEDEREAVNTLHETVAERQGLTLSFSGWGEDYQILPLLDLLAERKKHVTFFVDPHSTENNPNLLRYIAQQGHELAMVINRNQEITPEEGVVVEELPATNHKQYQENLVYSYQKLHKLAGDLKKADGSPSLRSFAMISPYRLSKERGQLIFSSGFSQLIVGNYIASRNSNWSPERMLEAMEQALPTKAMTLYLHSATDTTAALRQLLDKHDTPEAPLQIQQYSQYIE